MLRRYKSRSLGFRRNNMLHHSQLCSTNEEGLAHYSDCPADYLSRYPEIEVLGIIPNDGRGSCECTKCLDLEQSVPANVLSDPEFGKNIHINASGRYHRIVSFVSHRINDLYREVLGDRKLSFWAYHATIMPTEDVRRFPDNRILSGFAPYERCDAHALNADECGEYPYHLNQRFTSTIDKWNELYGGDGCMAYLRDKSEQLPGFLQER